MKLNDTDTYLAIVQHALSETVAPALHSPAALASLELINQCLQQIGHRRQIPLSELRETLSSGKSVYRSLLSVASERGIESNTHLDMEAEVIDTFDDYQQQHDLLSAQLADIIRALSKKRGSAPDDAGLSELFRRAAEWEAKADRVALPESTDRETSEKPDPLPVGALENYLNKVCLDGTSGVRLESMDRVPGGFGKQTYFIKVRSSEGPAHEMVLRKDDISPFLLHPSILIDREFYLLDELAGRGIPAPRPRWIGVDVPGVDADFYIMDRLPGKPLGAFLDGDGNIPETVALEMAEHLAKIHSITPDKVSNYVSRFEPELLDPQETGNSVWRRRIESWRDYAETVDTFPSVVGEYLLDWLENNIPEDDSPLVLVHGDYNIHNILADGGHVSGIIDWEYSGFGSHAEDLLYVKPNISQHIEWGKFYQHYLHHGGLPFDQDHAPFYQAFVALRARMAGGRVALNLHRNTVSDIRFSNFELGFNPVFVEMAMSSTRN